MVMQLATQDNLSYLSIEELKTQLLELVADQDARPLKDKVAFYKNQLEPYFVELQRRNRYPTAESQLPLVLGVWTPIWSTIPFHDILPGRIQQQSYQIFHDDGFYANVAHYVPGHQVGLLQKLGSLLSAYNLMVLQRFAARDGEWLI